MSEPRAPYYVNFSADRIPQHIDHSSSNPGPAGSTADRAGHTSVKFNGKGVLSFAPVLGPVARTGMAPFFFQSVNIYFRLTDFAVAISSDYSVRSCAYRATLKHELDAHIRAPIQIMYGYRDRLIDRLNLIPLPTRQAPRWIHPWEIDAVQDAYEKQVYKVVSEVRAEVSAALKQDRIDQDSPANYARVYDQCPVVEWSHTR
jgi:hypothetical protein